MRGLFIMVLLLLAAYSGWAQDMGSTSTIERADFFSNTLNRTYQYNVYLPAGYAESSERYPVIYLLHGRGDTMDAWLEARNALDEIIEIGAAPPTIAVMPDVPSSERASYYVDSQHAGPLYRPELVETAFFSDLIPHIDTAYRTMTNREGRLIGGYSMGGYGAMRYAMAHPEMFVGALVLSPAVYTPLPPADSSTREFGAFGRFGQLFDADIYTSLNYPALSEPLAESGLSLAMFIAVGDDEYKNPNPEDYMHDLDMEAHLLYNHVSRIPNVVAEFRVYDGGHDWAVWERGLREGLAFLGTHLQTPP